jgi:hypothetical protein
LYILETIEDLGRSNGLTDMEEHGTRVPGGYLTIDDYGDRQEKRTKSTLGTDKVFQNPEKEEDTQT